MRHFAGKAWVSETEYELVRLEAEAIETASFGLGLLARVHKGSKAAFERRKVNGEEWLPASASYTASARVCWSGASDRRHHGVLRLPEVHGGDGHEGGEAPGPEQ